MDMQTLRHSSNTPLSTNDPVVYGGGFLKNGSGCVQPKLTKGLKNTACVHNNQKGFKGPDRQIPLCYNHFSFLHKEKNGENIPAE